MFAIKTGGGDEALGRIARSGEGSGGAPKECPGEDRRAGRQHALAGDRQAGAGDQEGGGMKMETDMVQVGELCKEACELQQSYCHDVVQPDALMELYRPMKFKKLSGREHMIKRVKGECWEVSSF